MAHSFVAFEASATLVLQKRAPGTNRSQVFKACFRCRPTLPISLRYGRITACEAHQVASAGRAGSARSAD
jgi:hypothetical protein